MKSFKQKTVYAAIAAGASTLLAASAGAVNTNPDGLGEVLIYPYYTVRNGNATLISVVNTTTQAKVVKVRFLEGKNSNEVLDFNLWLSPFDVWTAAIVNTATGAGLVSGDASCTNPAVNTGAVIPFRNTAYSTGTFQDRPELRGLDRTREGYVEMIEMATVISTSATYAAVVHKSTGKPDCVAVNAITGATSPVITNAEVAIRSQTEYDPAPTGGLFGNGTIVGNSMSNGYNATAIQGFGYRGGPTSSNNLVPALGNGTNTTAVVVDAPSSGTTRVTAANFTIPIDAVSATLMHSAVLGEYAYSSDADGKPVLSTDWVITMPTKRRYVNGVLDPSASFYVARLPFQNPWDGFFSDVLGNWTGIGRSCDTVSLSSYDREEGQSSSEDDFSPNTTGSNSVCWEANIVSFGGLASAATTSFDTGPSRSLGSVNARGLAAYQRPGKEGGWASISFRAAALLGTANGYTTLVSGSAAPVTTGPSPVTFAGLPTIGFAVSDYRASTANGNYNAGYNLNFRRSIQPTFP